MYVLLYTYITRVFTTRYVLYIHEMYKQFYETRISTTANDRSRYFLNEYLMDMRERV